MIAAVLLVLALAQPNPEWLLERARERIRANAQALPRYTCTQTVDRELSRVFTKRENLTCPDLAGLRFEPWSRDRLRMDLIVADGKEQHQWTNGGVIDPDQLVALSYGGTLGTGDFSGFTASIFVNRAAHIEFQRALESAGRTVYQYRYTVPLEASHYHVGPAGGAIPVPYSGTFNLDASNGDLRQLTVRADRLAELVGWCSLETLVDFEHATIRGADVLIPGLTRLDSTIGPLQTTNTTHYSQCREFGAQSTIRFEVAESVSAPAAAPGRVFPKDTLVTLRLETPIDSRTSAAGDAVRARADDRAGTIFHGRIVRLARTLKSPKGFTLTLVFNQLEVAGGRQDVDMYLVSRRLWFPGDKSLDLRKGFQTKWIVR